MYLDKNKHTSFLFFTSYCVNICDVFILPSRVHFLSSFGSQLSPSLYAKLSLHIHASERPPTCICSTNPLALGSWGFSHFISKGLNYSISSPKDSNQILTNTYIPEPCHSFSHRRKVHDSNGVYIPCTWVKRNRRQ